MDSLLSEKRDREEAKRFFKQALDIAGHAPERVRIDGHDSSPRAIREILGHEVIHRCNRSLNKRIEQDHRGIKQRSSPMHGFGSFESAARFRRAFDELRHSFRPRHTMGKTVALAEQRRVFLERLASLQVLTVAAS